MRSDFATLTVIPAEAETQDTGLKALVADAVSLGPGLRRDDEVGYGRTMGGVVYILASRRHGTLYTGVTSELAQRVHQHREGTIPGFTADYGVKQLVWFEVHDDIEAAILREKRIKGWKRDWKIRLIEETNPDCTDLAVTVLSFEPLSSKRLHHRHPGEGRDPRTRDWR